MQQKQSAGLGYPLLSSDRQSLKSGKASRCRVVLFGQGFGIWPPILQRCQQEFDVVATFGSHISAQYKWLSLLRSFRLPKSAWRRRWYHYIEKTPAAFLAQTRTNAKRLDLLAGQYDAILTLGALHAPTFHINRPFFIVADSTRSLSSQNEHDDVSHFFDDNERRGWLALEKSVYLAATRIFVGSHFVKNSLVFDYAVPNEHVLVTGFGAGLTHAEIYDKHFDGKTVLFIGKGDFEKKGGRILLSAFELVRRQIPDAVLHLVGQKHLPQLPGVKIHGVISDRAMLRDLMKAAHLFVLPSLVDRNPITILEAMAAATPSISCDYGAIPELVGDTGVIVARNDATALAEAIVRILGNVALARQYGQNGRRRFEQKYNWDNVWAQMRTEMYDGMEGKRGWTERHIPRFVATSKIGRDI